MMCIRHCDDQSSIICLTNTNKLLTRSSFEALYVNSLANNVNLIKLNADFALHKSPAAKAALANYTEPIVAIGMSEGMCIVSTLSNLLMHTYNSRLEIQHISFPISITMIACSSHHCILANLQSIYVHGQGKYGELGLGSAILQVSVPTRLIFTIHSEIEQQNNEYSCSSSFSSFTSSRSPRETARAIAVSDYHSCIITAPYGYVYVCGHPAYHRLGFVDDSGHDLDHDHGRCYYEPVCLTSLIGVGQVNPSTGTTDGLQKISSGLWHTVACTSTGDVYGWGWNHFGQLHEDALGKKFLMQPERLSSLDTLLLDQDDEGEDVEDRVIDISCGSRSTAFLTQRGDVLIMGVLGASAIKGIDPGMIQWRNNLSIEDDTLSKSHESEQNNEISHDNKKQRLNNKEEDCEKKNHHKLRYLHQTLQHITNLNNNDKIQQEEVPHNNESNVNVDNVTMNRPKYKAIGITSSQWHVAVTYTLTT